MASSSAYLRSPGVEEIHAAGVALGRELEDAVCIHLHVWLSEMVVWNAKLDLTAARTKDELLDLMVADAVVLANQVDADQSLVDVGTGPGAPGLALALMRPDLKVTLVEPLAKRISFMRTALSKLKREDVLLRRCKLADIAHENLRFANVISRATLPSAEWLQDACTIAEPGARIALLTAREIPPEVDGLDRTEPHTYEWPLTRVSRTLTWYRAHG